jgi:hypothetical protein
LQAPEPPPDPGTIGAAPKQGFLSDAENLTQEGRKEHPVEAIVGDVARNAKELLTGGQSAGKPMGTSEGIINNPVTQSIAGAAVGGTEAAAEIGSAGSTAAKGAISTTVATAIKVAKWSLANPREAALYEFIAHEMGIDPYQIVKNVIKYGKGF